MNHKEQAMEQQLARLRAFNGRVRSAEPRLWEEAMKVPILEAAPVGTVADQQFILESIALRRTRPVFDILEDKSVLVFQDAADISIWRERLERAESVLRPAIRAVGRVELHGHSDFPWVGTGWLVAEDIIVTNRHVAQLFADHVSLDFLPGTNGRMSAEIDFVREFNSTQRRPFRLKKALYVEPFPGPDLAFFKVEVSGGGDSLAPPIGLASNVEVAPHVAVVGYPARDTRIPDLALMEQLYGARYETKRLAPGAVTRVDSSQLLHNCTTLGGNSGSAVLDLETGVALGLHFSGVFLDTNFAVRADVVRDRLETLTRSDRPRRPPPAPRPQAVRGDPPTPPPRAVATVTIPLVISVSLGGPAQAAPMSMVRPRRRTVQRAPSDEFDSFDEEAVAADYADRVGYVRGFLGAGNAVELPAVIRNGDDVLEYGDNKEKVLHYEHFSLVMSRSRRMCVYSAVNIDGSLSKKSKRSGWKTDPRIPQHAQIKHECYGDPPKFSRGHMTRREDPAWGNTAQAKRGSDDSMHVTNAVPQMQAFNSPIWLELEDYALQNAREDDMKISVFTGPYFDFDGVHDPVYDGVRVPRSFWKVIAFINDQTQQLCATGYEMSQDGNLPAEEIVFGQLTSTRLKVATQVPISRIEQRAGLRFDRLASVDPLTAHDEAVGSDDSPLERLEQIRFF